jgi:hypothetical protein
MYSEHYSEQRSNRDFGIQEARALRRTSTPTINVISELGLECAFQNTPVPQNDIVNDLNDRLKNAAGVSSYSIDEVLNAVKRAQSINVDPKLIANEINRLNQAVSCKKHYNPELLNLHITEKLQTSIQKFEQYIKKYNPYFADYIDSEYARLDTSDNYNSLHIFFSDNWYCNAFDLTDLPPPLLEAIIAMVNLLRRNLGFSLVDDEILDNEPFLYELSISDAITTDHIKELVGKMEFGAETTISELIETMSDAQQKLLTVIIDTFESFVGSVISWDSDSSFDEIHNTLLTYLVVKEHSLLFARHDNYCLNTPEHLAWFLTGLSPDIRSNYPSVIEWLESSCHLCFTTSPLDNLAVGVSDESGEALGNTHIQLFEDIAISEAYEPVLQYSMETGWDGTAWPCNEPLRYLFSLISYSAIFNKMISLGFNHD